MNVLIVNTYDRGGAANACLRLHKGLLESGVDSSVLLLHKQKEISNTYKFQLNNNKIRIKNPLNFFKKNKNSQLKIKQSLKQKFLKNRKKELEWFSFPDSNFDITTSKLYEKADVVNLHWVANFLDYNSFFKKNTKPVVWTLHDMNPFSGGEHYEEQHLGLDDNGFPKKRKISSIEELIFKQVLDYKKQALKNFDDLHIVTLSKWMSKEVKKSSILNRFPSYRIPNGLNPELFKYHDKKQCRNILGLPENKKIILFVSDSNSNARKGLVYLQKAYAELKLEDVILCTVGNNNDEITQNHNVINLGVIDKVDVMSKVYSAADVFVIPSLIDNLPNTVLESLMCGTPVIGFPVGGIPDMIEHGVNGLLTKEVSVSSLKQTIKSFFDTYQNFNQQKIRANAVEKYSLNKQTKAYIGLFSSILKNNSKG